MLQVARKFGRDERGATAIEYALIAGLLAAVIIGAVSSVGTKLSNTFTTASAGLN